MRLSLRLKLTLVSLLLLAIPLVGIRLSAIMNSDLVRSRQETLMFSSRAVASALTGRPGLFDQELFHSLDNKHDIYLFNLTNPMRLNGKYDDWYPQLDNATIYGHEHQTYPQAMAPRSTLNFKHMAGKRGEFLYALFIVNDEKVVYRDSKSLRLDLSDHLKLQVENNLGERKTYIITAEKTGWVNGFLMPDKADSHIPIANEKTIQGVWEETNKGYILEMRIPMKMIGKKLAFTVVDVDDKNSRETVTMISTSNPDKPENIGWLLPNSDEIAQILESLNRPNSRIQIIDVNRRVRASFGSLSQEEDNEKEKNHSEGKLRALLFAALTPVFGLFTEPVTNTMLSAPLELSTLDIDGVHEALEGRESINRYHNPEDNVEIMAAITPLKDNGEIMGAVVVEQTTNSILALKNKMIEESVVISLFTFLISSSGLLIFASILSSRIRKLRDQAAGAVSKSGQIQGAIVPIHSNDEIGDLARTLASLLNQLKEHIEYKEKMADNLEHEMRTPLAGISAALKNIDQELENCPEEIQNYISWALADAKRLENLLSVIRDAANLNEALTRDTHEIFSLKNGLDLWLERSWKLSYPETEIILNLCEDDLEISGDPARIKQMLDKIVDNGVSFLTPQTPLTITLKRKPHFAVVIVHNHGPIISDEHIAHIFNSMISIRSQKKSKMHLGLGLYIVRVISEHHGGLVKVENVEDNGVQFTVEIPLSTPA